MRVLWWFCSLRGRCYDLCVQLGCVRHFRALTTLAVGWCRPFMARVLAQCRWVVAERAVIEVCRHRRGVVLSQMEKVDKGQEEGRRGQYEQDLLDKAWSARGVLHECTPSWFGLPNTVFRHNGRLSCRVQRAWLTRATICAVLARMVRKRP